MLNVTTYGIISNLLEGPILAETIRNGLRCKRNRRWGIVPIGGSY